MVWQFAFEINWPLELEAILLDVNELCRIWTRIVDETILYAYKQGN